MEAAKSLQEVCGGAGGQSYHDFLVSFGEFDGVMMLDKLKRILIAR
jgi:hypothetical protein